MEVWQNATPPFVFLTLSVQIYYPQITPNNFLIIGIKYPILHTVIFYTSKNDKNITFYRKM